MGLLRVLLAWLALIAGMLFGIYVGVWVCFIGGIVQIVHAAMATPVEAMGIAIGAAKVCFTGVVMAVIWIFSAVISKLFLGK